MASFTVRLRRLALGDIRRIRFWYRNIDPSVELRFVESLNEAIERIQSFPLAYQIVDRNMRRVSLKKFPYSVFYVARQSHAIVVSVMHHKRDPGIALSRSE